MKGGFLGYLIISTEATALTSSWIHKIHVQLDAWQISLWQISSNRTEQTVEGH